MGKLVKGVWRTSDWTRNKGEFIRQPTTFRDRVRADGSTAYAPEAGRYHLYVSYACPWAHRTLIGRALLGLEHAISVTVVDPLMSGDGWAFDDPDPILGAAFLREVYQAADDAYTGRVTVPVLWDKERATIVNNESREILRMFDHEFAALKRNDVDLAPPGLVEAVDAKIDEIYQPINNGVYRCGFASTQEAYDAAVGELFEALDACDALLADHRFLLGERFTEADICLFTTLARFDIVYYTHFKCNVRHIYEYEHLDRFAREVYAMPGVAEVTDFDHIKRHYYWSHESINPQRIVPAGPAHHLGAS